MAVEWRLRVYHGKLRFRYSFQDVYKRETDAVRGAGELTEILAMGNDKWRGVYPHRHYHEVQNQHGYAVYRVYIDRVEYEWVKRELARTNHGEPVVLGVCDV